MPKTIRKINLVQVGAGGTGSWFARTLMHILTQILRDGKVPAHNIDFVWDIIDPDIVEARNIIRQPFYGGEGQSKSLYLAGLVSEFISYTRVAATANLRSMHVYGRDFTILKEGEEWLCYADTVLQSMKNNINDKDEVAILFLISCVDNTYTRKVLEEWILDITSRSEAAMPRIYYLNMGVSPDGEWLSELIRDTHLMLTPYEEITYPDELLSCSVREEIGVVPQTVYSNVMAGTTAAQLLADALIKELLKNCPEEELSSIVRIYGEKGGSVLLPVEEYYLDRMPVAPPAVEETETEEEKHKTEGEKENDEPPEHQFPPENENERGVGDEDSREQPDGVQDAPF